MITKKFNEKVGPNRKNLEKIGRPSTPVVFLKFSLASKTLT